MFFIFVNTAEYGWANLTNFQSLKDYKLSLKKSLSFDLLKACTNPEWDVLVQKLFVNHKKALFFKSSEGCKPS